MNNRLKELRKKLNLTQTEFGNNLNLSKSTISGLESGAIALTERNLKEICSKFEVNEIWLKEGIGDVFIDLNADDEFSRLCGTLAGEKDEFKKKIIKALLKLDEDELLVFKNFVQSLQ